MNDDIPEFHMCYRFLSPECSMFGPFVRVDGVLTCTACVAAKSAPAPGCRKPEPEAVAC